MNYSEFVAFIEFLERFEFLASLANNPQPISFENIQKKLEEISRECWNFFYDQEKRKANPKIAKFYQQMLSPRIPNFYYRFFHYLFAWHSFWDKKLSFPEAFILSLNELYSEFCQNVAIEPKFRHFAFLYYLAYRKYIQSYLPGAEFLKKVDLFPELYSMFFSLILKKFFSYQGKETDNLWV